MLMEEHSSRGIPPPCGLLMQAQAEILGRSKGQDVAMLVHHSRNSEQKKWDETLVLALSGMGRLLRMHLLIIAPMQAFPQVLPAPVALWSPLQLLAIAMQPGGTPACAPSRRRSCNSDWKRAKHTWAYVSGTKQAPSSWAAGLGRADDDCGECISGRPPRGGSGSHCSHHPDDAGAWWQSISVPADVEAGSARNRCWC